MSLIKLNMKYKTDIGEGNISIEQYQLEKEIFHYITLLLHKSNLASTVSYKQLLPMS